MSPNSLLKVRNVFLPVLAAAAILMAGCGSSLTGSSAASVPMGSAFVVGTDAPLASVVSFEAQITGITMTSSATGATANLLGTNTPTVDFARYNGLQGLVDMNDVPAGTYDKVTISLGTVNIGYLDTTKTPPAIVTEPATLSPSSASTTITLNKPLTITATGGQPVGLRIDLDLAQTIPVTNGAIGTTVTPTFNVTTVARTDQGAHIDEFVGAVTTPPSSATATSFVITGPHGEPFTINVSSSTEWDGGATLATLNTNSIVEVAGQFDPADQTLDADEVALISDKGFYAGGLITYVAPSTTTGSSAAPSFDFYVRALLPDSTAVQLGDIAQVNLTGNEKYGIYWMHNAFTNLLFNASALAPGQEIRVGGQASAETSLSALTVDRIHLENWGYNGTVVAGSQSAGQGTFQMQVTGFAGVVIPTNITVYLGPVCDFRYGFGQFGDLSDGATVRVVGILLKNQSNGQLVLLARHVDGFNFTDFSTTAWQ
jgi:Domain of unknown function (DUF4382)/Domain of unknown function (DUF5666)